MKKRRRKPFLFKKVSYDSVYFLKLFNIEFFVEKKIDVIPFEPREIMVFPTQLCIDYKIFISFFINHSEVMTLITFTTMS